MKKIIFATTLLFAPIFAFAVTLNISGPEGNLVKTIETGQQNSFMTDLAYGMTGSVEVMKLQEFLADEGLYSGPITGNFFSLTMKAVKAFQYREGIAPAAGYFGPKTRARASALLGMQTSASNQQVAIETAQTAAQPAAVSSANSAQTQLDALLKQILLLQQQLAAQKQTSVSNVTSSQASAPTITVDITPSSGTMNTSANTYASQAPANAVFYEDFSGIFPGNKWVVSGTSGYTTQPSPQIDANIGNPAASLAMPFSSGGSNVIIQGKKVAADANPFNSADGFSVSFDVRQPDTSAETVAYSSSGWVRNFKFEIKHLTNQYAYANLEIRPDAELVHYGIYKAYVGGGGSYVSAPYNSDANFHTYKFTVDADGNAKWFRDGILKNSFGGFPVGDYTISFSASGRNLPVGSLSTATYYHNVDNVAVTVP